MWRRLLTWAAGVSVGVGFGCCIAIIVASFVLPAVLPKRTIWNTDGSSATYRNITNAGYEVWTGSNGPYVDGGYDVNFTAWPLAFNIVPVIWFFTSLSAGSRWLKRATAALLFLSAYTVWWCRIEQLSLCPMVAGGIVTLVAVLIHSRRALFDMPSRAQRRLARGLCPKCGYDIRATPEGGTLLSRCPECGTVI